MAIAVLRPFKIFRRTHIQDPVAVFPGAEICFIPYISNPGILLREFPADHWRSIIRCVIGNDQFKVPVILPEYRLDTPAQSMLFTIVNAQSDRYLAVPVFHGYLHSMRCIADIIS
jgi:hypothetical protein